MTQSLDLNTMYQPKATRAEVLNRVMTDYDEAISELPDKLYSDSQTSGRFTVSAVKALKARILLFDAYDSNGKAISSKMEEVLTLLQSIKGYSLAARVRDNFYLRKAIGITGDHVFRSLPASEPDSFYGFVLWRLGGSGPHPQYGGRI